MGILFNSLKFIIFTYLDYIPPSSQAKITQMQNENNLCKICFPHANPNKKVALILKRLYLAFQKPFLKIQISQNDDQSHKKEDFLVKIIDYLMKGLNVKQEDINLESCQKHNKIRKFLCEKLNLNQEDFQIKAQQIATKILKGKYELNIVLHLIKNLAKSKSLQKNNKESKFLMNETLKKTQKLERNQFKNEKAQQKSETGSLTNQQQKNQQKSMIQKKVQQVIDLGKKQIEGKNLCQNMWNSYFQQYQLYSGFFPSYLYYGHSQ